MRRDGLCWSRSKADFRMLRDVIGVSQAWVAKRLGVSVLTVKNWESPGEFYPPRREAWDLLAGLWREADGKAAALVEIAVEARRMAVERGVEPAPMPLSYWRTIKDWARVNGDEGSWRVANAATRMAADRLHVLGVPVTVRYVETEA